MKRSITSCLLTVCLVAGLGLPTFANDLSVSVSLPSSAWQGRLHANGVLNATFSGSATTSFSNCQSLFSSVRARFEVTAEIGGQSSKLRFFDTAEPVSVSTSSITCRISYFGLDVKMGQITPSKLITSVDGQPQGSLDVIFQPFGLEPSQPAVLNLTRGQEVSAPFTIQLDEPSNTAPYTGLIVKICKDACTPDSKGYWLDYIDDSSKLRVREKQTLVGGGNVKLEGNSSIQVNAPSLSGMHTIQIIRHYAASCSLGAYEESRCSRSIWDSKKYSTEIVLNIKSSKYSNPAARYRVSDLSNMAKEGILVTQTSSCEGDYGFIECFVGITSEPLALGKMRLSMYWALDSQKPKLHKNFDLALGTSNRFYFNPKISKSSKTIKIFFVWDGSSLSRTKSQNIKIVRPSPAPRPTTPANKPGSTPSPTVTKVFVPNFIGLSRAQVRKLNQDMGNPVNPVVSTALGYSYSVSCQISGRDRVITQSPAAGKEVARGTLIALGSDC